MHIAIDTMGGDHAPEVIVKGAIQALKENPPDLNLILVGQPDAIEPYLKNTKIPTERLQIYPASQIASMETSPSFVLRQMRDSSIRVCFDLHKANQVQAVISAGNSGATMAVGLVVMGRLSEVDRPALASIMPNLKGSTVLIDVGANVDCSPLMLLQFGYMGSIYAEKVLGIPNPTVGLLSIGEEDIKGNNVVKQANEHFKNSALNFMGNVEGRDIFSGNASVVVCDGFVGNICLKVSEGLVDSIITQLKQKIISPFITGQLAAILLKNPFNDLYQRIDYANYGGVPLLGINGIGLICHGSSSPRAITSAIRVATECIRGQVIKHLEKGLIHYRKDLLEGNKRNSNI